MATIKRAKYQFLRNLVTGSLVTIVLVALIGGLMKNILIFMLTGIIEGTSIVVPVWGMYLIYAGIFLVIIADMYLEYRLENRHIKTIRVINPTPVLPARQLPRRRYSH